ncbi:MAG TPA: rRNA cytosine-C5-methylase [Propionibacteriaceae bacterium]|nr:rRNA cytosine-C5-methylase [Micropruina sp.]HBX80836.1 rRNA cytosine-C5-methylase [Propionibacteriaceae bacterium]HBY22706.1 rRNA cytosine-C5-methylase [Propionibacteriaceae bacterium]
MARPVRRPSSPAARQAKAPTDPARLVAFRTLRAVVANGAYANLELQQQREQAHLNERDAALATELVFGTTRLMGTYDRIIVAASGRELSSLQPAVVDILRLGAHQLLSMRMPAHAAVSATVDLAAAQVGERVRGVVNAILRRVGARTLDEWLDALAEGLDDLDALALRTHHPRWIVAAYAEVLPADELEGALLANNVAPHTVLAARPGLLEPDDLGLPLTRYSPFGAVAHGDPGQLAAVQAGLAGVQDEGSQLVALALARVEAPAGTWLDTCAGPGGKAALLVGLAQERGESLLANERLPHRAELVAQAVRAYDDPRPWVIVGDATRPPWGSDRFARVMVDAPCTGLGALRRRPESRWRRLPTAVAELVELQKAILTEAVRSAVPGGVVAYVTCSPVRAETAEVVRSVLAEVDAELVDAAALLPEVPDCADGTFVQLWPHRHGTDAMFLALLRRR